MRFSLLKNVRILLWQMFWKSACGRFSLSLYSWLSNGWGHHRRQGKRRKKLMILFSSFHLPRDDSLAFPFFLKTFFLHFRAGSGCAEEDGTQTHPEPWGLIRILRGERKWEEGCVDKERGSSITPCLAGRGKKVARSHCNPFFRGAKNRKTHFHVCLFSIFSLWRGQKE